MAALGARLEQTFEQDAADSVSSAFSSYLATHRVDGATASALGRKGGDSGGRSGGNPTSVLLSAFLCCYDIPALRTIEKAEAVLGGVPSMGAAMQAAGAGGGGVGGGGSEAGVDLATVDVILWAQALRAAGVHVPAAALLKMLPHCRH